MAHALTARLLLAPLVLFPLGGHAQSFQYDKLSFTPRLLLQARATSVLDAQDANGDAYDPLRGQLGHPEPVRLDLRPLRLGGSIKYGDHWRGFIIIRSERLDLNSAAVFNRLVHLFLANVEFAFQTGSLEHALHLGLDKPWNNESSIPTFSGLFPSDRLVAIGIGVRGVGLGYLLRGPSFLFAADVQSNNTLVKDKQAGNLIGAEEKNGYFYSARLEVAPTPEWMITRKLESFAGRKGHGLLFGFDLQHNGKNLDDDRSEDTFTRTSTLTFGPDLLFHWDGLSALAELRWRRRGIAVVPDTGDAAAASVSQGRFWNVQAGYAIAAAELVVEPALGYAQFDNDTHVTSTPAYGNGTDQGGDGTTFTAGVNVYFDGHSNKLQLAYQHWRAEGGHGRTSIIRFQHQIAF